jgi:arsenite methyltransferase
MRSADETRTLVRERYATIARERESCCAPSASCGCGPEMAPDGLNVIGDAYAGVAGHVADADLNLGCGVPTRLAALAAGESVLDLGSGAGNDAFIARHEVGSEGRVVGVDMTPEMIAKARANAAKLGYDNVEFRLGEIEHLPVEAASVDVVISNCVLNLVPDKARAFAEIFRVVKPGGRFCISDIVSVGDLSEAVRRDAELLVGCVAGAMDKGAYLELVEAAGFDAIRIAESRRLRLPAALTERCGAASLESVTVVATKPPACCEPGCCT